MTGSPGLLSLAPSSAEILSYSSLSRTSQSNFIIDLQESPGKSGMSDPQFPLWHFMSLGQSRTLLPGSWPLKRETELIIPELIVPELLIPADERDLEDFLLDFEEDLKALHSVQCSPSPGEKGIRPAQQQYPPLILRPSGTFGYTSRQNLCRLCSSSISHPMGTFKIQMFVPWSWSPFINRIFVGDFWFRLMEMKEPIL